MSLSQEIGHITSVATGVALGVAPIWMGVNAWNNDIRPFNEQYNGKFDVVGKVEQVDTAIEKAKAMLVFKPARSNAEVGGDGSVSIENYGAVFPNGSAARDSIFQSMVIVSQTDPQTRDELTNVFIKIPDQEVITKTSDGDVNAQTFAHERKLLDQAETDYESNLSSEDKRTMAEYKELANKVVFEELSLPTLGTISAVIGMWMLRRGFKGLG